MAEDNSSPDNIKQLDDRLNQLESFARGMISRLDTIEKQIAFVLSGVRHDLKTSNDQREAYLSRLRAIEETLKTAASSDKLTQQEKSGGQMAKPTAPTIEKRAGESKSQPQDTGGESAKGLEDRVDSPNPQRPSLNIQSEIESPAPPPQSVTAPQQPPETTTVPTPPSAVDSTRPFVKAPPTAVVREPITVHTPPTAVHPITPASRAEQMKPTPIYRSAESSQQHPDLESRIGGRWLLWIGVVAISFGMAFFLKYAFDNQWISPGWRVNIGVAIGLAFLLGAERLRARYPIYSNGLSGGGIFILYLSIFVGFNTYGLIPQPPAFALMAAVTATASLLAARYSALPIAILGLIGGFLTPILLSTGVDNEAGLFGYIALLDMGVLALAYSKQWRSLNYMAFIATVLMFVAWYGTWYTPAKLWTTIFFLTLFFMIFALLAVLHNVANRRPVRWLDLAMVFSNALLYFGSTYELLEPNYYGLLGLFAVLVSAFYMGLGYLTYRRDREDILLIYTFLGLAFLFAVLAVPIHLDQHWVTMAWAMEGAALTWIGLKASDRTSRYAAVLVFGVALAHWFRTDVREFAYHANETFLPLLNRRALSCAVFVAALAAAAAFYKRMKSDVEDQERSRFNGLYLLAANTLAVILLSIDVIDYFEQARAAVSGSGHHALMSVNNTRALALTALWAIYGACALVGGVTQRIKPLRYLALVLLSGATVKVLAVDLNYYAASSHTLILNQTFMAFAATVAALALGVRFYARNVEADDEEREVVLPMLIGAANVLAVIALAAEALAYFDRAQLIADGVAVAHLENVKHLALSAVFIVYGATALIIGIRRRSAAVRFGALILLALATMKAFAIDLRFYSASWHTTLLNPTFAAFALLIIAFAVGAWFYSRAEDIEERNNVIAVLVAAANVLAVVALTAEVLGYFDRAQAIASVEAITRLENAKQLVVSALWTTCGTAGLIIGIRHRWRGARIGSLVLLALATLKVVAVDLPYYSAPWHTLLVNPTFAAFALLIVGLAACTWFYSRAEEFEDHGRRIIIQTLVSAASLLALVGLSAETIGYFDRARSQVTVQLSNEIARLNNGEQFVLSALWTTFGTAALIAGIKRDWKPFRWGGTILFAVVTFKLATVDLEYFRAPWHTLIFNETFGVFALLIVALASSVWFYSGAEDIDKEERSTIVPLFIVAVNLLAIVALSTEVLGYFGKNLRADGVTAEDFRNLQFARQLWLSLVWTLYAGGMLIVGIARRSKLLRIMGLSLLGITIFKVFLFDLSSLEKLYRTVSFIVLGAILLAVSFLYQRYRRQVAEFIDVDAQEPVSAE